MIQLYTKANESIGSHHTKANESIGPHLFHPLFYTTSIIIVLYAEFFFFFFFFSGEFIQILHLLYTLMLSMASPKSSAGSKDLTGCKDSREALQSSWIRRLNLRPTSHSSPPPTSPPPPPPVNNSPSTTDSGYAMIGGHLTDTSSHESRTPNPMLDASTTLFLHRLLKLRKQKPPPLRAAAADPESFSVSGFGPFQVQTRRRVVVSSTDEVVKDDSVAGMNFNYSRNSSSDACFPTVQTMTPFVVEEEEEEKMEKNPSLQQQNWLPRNHTTLFTEKILFSSENHNSSSSAPKPQEMLNVEKRSLSDEQHNNTHSPFLQYWSSLKKLVYTKAKPVTTLPGNECLFGPSREEADNKFNNTNQDSCNLNHSLPVAVGGENKCSSSSRNLVAGAQRLPIRHFTASPRPMMTKASHEISYFPRNGGIITTYHDGVAGRSYQGSHPTTQNAAPVHQHERHTPACSNETADPSSFWNMNSFQRAEMVSSIFRACRTGNKKRNANADVFLSMKSRKLDPEG